MRFRRSRRGSYRSRRPTSRRRRSSVRRRSVRPMRIGYRL